MFKGKEKPSVLRYREIIFKPSVSREFGKLPSVVQKQIKRKIDSLANEPRPDGVKKLHDEDGLYCVRSGDYRIIYQIKDHVLIVLVLKVGHRRDVYR